MNVEVRHFFNYEGNFTIPLKATAAVVDITNLCSESDTKNEEFIQKMLI